MQTLHIHTLPSALMVLQHLGELARAWPGTLLVHCIVVRLRSVHGQSQYLPGGAACTGPACLHASCCMSSLRAALPPVLQPRQWPSPLHAPSQVFIFFGTSFLLLRQLLLVAGNLTTNEFLLRHKCARSRGPWQLPPRRPVRQLVALRLVALPRSPHQRQDCKNAGAALLARCHSSSRAPCLLPAPPAPLGLYWLAGIRISRLSITLLGTPLMRAQSATACRWGPRQPGTTGPVASVLQSKPSAC